MPQLTRKQLLCAALLPAFAPRRACGNYKDAAADAAPTPKLETETLPNGTRLVVLSDASEDLVALDAFFRVGLADEGGLGGVRSLIARSWVGEAEFRSAPLLLSDIARFGGGIGTGCAEDWVDIWSVGKSDETTVRAQMQTLFTHLVARPVFSAKNISEARASQERALLLSRDDLWAQVTAELKNRAWDTSPLSRPLLGDGETLPKLTHDSVTDFYQTYFRASRAVIVAAGNITFEAAKRLTLASLGAGAWNEGRPAPPQKPLLQDTISPNLRTRLVSRHAPATLVAVGLLAPGTETGRTEYAALLLMDAILGGGKASRLFGLRENNQVAYDLRTRIEAGRAQSLWAAYVIGNAPPKETLGLVNGVLDDWASGKTRATEAELARAKILLTTRHLSNRQRLQGRAWGLGWAETMGLGAEWETQFAARINAVGLDEVNRLARRVLGGNRAVVQSLGPQAG